MAPLDAPADKSPICVHLRRGAAFIYSRAPLLPSTEALRARANASSGVGGIPEPWTGPADGGTEAAPDR